MDSPVRKMLKRNDYNRHKLLRKIKRLRRAQVEQQKTAAEKELKRRLRVTPPKFGDGKDPQYKANTFAGRVTGVVSGDQDKVNTADQISSAISMIPLAGLVPSSLDLGYDLNRLYHNRDYETTKDVGMDVLSMIPLMPKVRFNLAKKAVDPMLYTLLNIYKKYGKYVNRGLWGVKGTDTYLDATDHNVQKHDNGKMPTLLDADKVRMNEQGLFLDEAGNIVGDSVVLPELTVRPTTPQTNDNSYYQKWLMRQADRGGRNMSSSDREAYDKMMQRIANQNEVKNFTGFDGAVYNHGSGALEQVSPEFDALTLGRQLYTDGIVNAICKGVNKKVSKGTSNHLPFIQWTPEQWTAAQDAAIARGDMVEAQRLRDLHFKVSAPNTKIVDKNGNPLHTYHGGQKGITEFLNPNEFDTSIKLNNYYKDGRNRIGIYTSDWESYAKQYARGYKRKDRYIYDLYVNMENPRYIGYLETKLNQLRNLNPFRKKDYLNPSVIRPEHKEQLLSGYDGVKWDIENAVFNGKQLKSADAVTYDDKGVRIPLGLRDNFKSKDIRYGIIPLIGGAALSVNRQEER